MKINTKTCTPIKGSSTVDSVLVHPNKYIPGKQSLKSNVVTPDACLSTSGSNANKTENKSGKEPSAGRECKYLATIVYTPILTSKRLEEEKNKIPDKTSKKNKTQRLIVAQDDLQDLNQKLENLFLKEDTNGAKNDDETATASTVSADEPPKSEATLKSEPGPLLGRFYKWVFNYKTNTQSQVLRSARIAAQEIKM